MCVICWLTTGHPVMELLIILSETLGPVSISTSGPGNISESRHMRSSSNESWTAGVCWVWPCLNAEQLRSSKRHSTESFNHNVWWFKSLKDCAGLLSAQHVPGDKYSPGIMTGVSLALLTNNTNIISPVLDLQNSWCVRTLCCGFVGCVLMCLLARSIDFLEYTEKMHFIILKLWRLWVLRFLVPIGAGLADV